ncbi:glycosyltransferase [Streptomyces sp. T-3]|nr:glycosyltransferase [Streptomyces sp. T-3]
MTPDEAPAPDVTVVVAVYNTLPYLTECLDSLVRQSIGHARMQIVTVDDGSTDGSGEVLDAYAARHPGLFGVVHQPNSGGPAAPSNRALELARGRYVFFLGADDHLGDEALERMVDGADTYGADVLLAKMVGVNDRAVPKVFDRNIPELQKSSWRLVWALSNTKLFRRELIERHHIRYQEELTAFSDQPFVLEAAFRAERISMLSDYDFYYAVRREDAGNITLRSRHEARLRGMTAAMAVTERFTEPGPHREALNRRHFTWEAEQLLRENFLDLDEAQQRDVVAGLRTLVLRHCTDAVLARLDVRRRVRLDLVRHEELDRLRAVIAYEAEHGTPPPEVRDGRVFAGYPGLDGPGRPVPDEVRDITGQTLERIDGQRLTFTSVGWQRGGRRGTELRLVAESSLPDLTLLDPDPVRLTGLAPDSVLLTPGDESTRIEIRIPVRALPEGRSIPVLRTGLLGRTQELAVPATKSPGTLRTLRRLRPHRVTTRSDAGGRLVVDVTPIRLRRLIALRLRRLSPLGGK